MEIAYSQKPGNERKAVKATGRDLNISFKDAVVVADWVRGKKVTQAMNMLEAVINMKQPVPYMKFSKGVGHRKGDHKFKIGKYPKKVSTETLNVLKNIVTNAEYKGLDAEKLKLTHIQAQKGIAQTRRKPKGRWKLWSRQLVSIQAIAEEK